VNHIAVGALLFAFGALFTFSAASAVQYWALSQQTQTEFDPQADRGLVRPAYESRKRSNDCQTPLWPQAGLPSPAKANYQQR
jgi:hypothetical protein